MDFTGLPVALCILRLRLVFLAPAYTYSQVVASHTLHLSSPLPPSAYLRLRLIYLHLHLVSLYLGTQTHLYSTLHPTPSTHLPVFFGNSYCRFSSPFSFTHRIVLLQLLHFILLLLLFLLSIPLPFPLLCISHKSLTTILFILTAYYSPRALKLYSPSSLV